MNYIVLGIWVANFQIFLGIIIKLVQLYGLKR